MRRFTRGFADALRLRPVVVVGRAMGGAVAIALALTQPQRVRALVLVATPARFEIPRASLDTWRDVMLRPRHAAVLHGALLAEDRLRRHARGVDGAGEDRSARALHRPARLQRRRLRRAARRASTVPTLVITGRDDHFAPPEKAEDAAAAHSRARSWWSSTMPGTRCPSEQPEAVQRARSRREFRRRASSP